MSHTSYQNNEITNLIDTWMNIATNFWQNLDTEKNEEDGPPPASSRPADTGDPDDDRFKTYKTWETTLNNYTSFLRLMTAPENQEALSKSGRTYMEAMIQASSDSLESLTEMQSKIIQTCAKVGEHTTAYNFDELDHRAFEAYRELYRSELQKYLYIPKIGLERQSHEQFSSLIDNANIFYSHLSELLFLFQIPFEKTNRVMQEKVRQMLERGEFVEDSKQSYNEWIKTLESHFSELLKSPEYTTVLNNTIGSLSDYKRVKHDVINSYLKELQIPTNKEMDEVYRDLYQTKKKLAELTRQVAAIQAELNALSA